MSAPDKYASKAEKVLDLILCGGPDVPDSRADAIKDISKALREAEAKGMRRAAKIVAARGPIYITLEQQNAIRECVSSILSDAERFQAGGE